MVVITAEAITSDGQAVMSRTTMSGEHAERFPELLEWHLQRVREEMAARCPGSPVTVTVTEEVMELEGDEE